jgi:hypothetical protein
MKKYVLKATALAIGALVGGGAFAAVTTVVDLNAGTGAKSYAKELVYNDATPLVGFGGAETSAADGRLNFAVKAGFGISTATTRYIRIDLTNATFDAAPGTTLGTNIDVGTLTGAGGSTVVIAAGGTAGDSYVIYQVTTGAGESVSQTDLVNIAVPALRVTSTGSAVKATYTLHETGTSAQTGTGGNAVLTTAKTGDIATFATGVDYSILTKPTTTASVEQSFKQFKTGGGYVAADKAILGTVTLKAKTAVLEHDGSNVDWNDLVAAGTKLVVAGDLSVRAGADDAAKKQSVFISTTNNACTSSINSNTVPSASGAEIVTDTTEITDKAICYVVDGTSAIPTADYTLALDVTAASGTSTADVAAAAFGSINRDGTELHAPFATIYSGTGNRAVLTSTHTADAAVEASVITEDGVTCNAGTSSFTLKAGKQLFINSSDVCPSLSAGTRFSLKLVIAAPNSKIYGVYNSYTYDAATAKVTDLSSYPLQRPAN